MEQELLQLLPAPGNDQFFEGSIISVHDGSGVAARAAAAALTAAKASPTTPSSAPLLGSRSGPRFSSTAMAALAPSPILGLTVVWTLALAPLPAMASRSAFAPSPAPGSTPVWTTTLASASGLNLAPLWTSALTSRSALASWLALGAAVVWTTALVPPPALGPAPIWTTIGAMGPSPTLLVFRSGRVVPVQKTVVHAHQLCCIP